MGSIRSQFSDGLMFNEFLVVTGSVTETQFPTDEVGMVRFKSDLGNNGVFFLGNRADNCIFPLYAGEDTGWNSLNDMNELYHRNPSGSSDYLYYWLQK